MESEKTMSKDEHGLTPLQAVIKETIEAHPAIDDDKEIAKMVFETRYPDEKYEGKDPSHAYVGKIRRRLAVMGEAPEFVIEPPEEPDYEEFEVEPPEEPEKPFQEEFEPPLEPDFEPPPEFVEGFTQDDTEFILCFTFDKFADWSGYEGWRFKQDDQGKLIDRNEIRFAGLTHRMMEKYVPDMLDQYFMEFMFCYTGIMLIGEKTKGYVDWRQRNKPLMEDLKDVESTVVEETPPESTEASEIPDAEDEKTPTDDEPLPTGALAKGEDEFKKRIKRQTP